METPMDLPVSKLIRPSCLAWCSSNNAVSLSSNQGQPGSLVGRFQVCHVNGWRFHSWLGLTFS